MMEQSLGLRRVFRFAMLCPCLVLSLALFCSPQLVSGQSYPSKPIRIITSEPGGGADLVARLVAQGLTAGFGQQAIVDNRGGNAVIQAQIMARALPDGYTLLTSGNNHWILPVLQAVPYDPRRDYSPITLTTSSPALLAVHPSVAAHSVKELIALAKTKPGELNYASGAQGSTTHLASELFKAMAGINIVRVTYKGSGPAVLALIAGEVQMMFFPASSGMQHVKSGRVKALAVASAQPSPLAPGLPSVAASGLPGYESGTFHAVFAPAHTPSSIVGRLNQQIVRFINTPEVKEQLFKAGLEIVGSSPQDAAAIIGSEMARFGKVIKSAGIAPD
jgi:tripartite-type tricarboxylate transporter receptor subunit TctC